MNKIFLVLLCGLLWANFFIQRLDIWHAQGTFFQTGLLILFCWSFFKLPSNIKVTNRPLGIFALWVGINTAFYCYICLVNTQKYGAAVFLPFFNFLCFLIFYKLSLEYLNRDDIQKIWRIYSYNIMLLLGYCILQILKLDQFYTPQILIGTIGNTVHLAGFLALCQPFFFEKKWYNIISLIILWFIIIYTGSIAARFVGIAMILFWFILKRKYKLASLIGIIALLLLLYSDFNPSGRFELWKVLFEKIKEKPLTGWGLGIFNIWEGVSIGKEIWRNAHSEYFQTAIIFGIPGLIILSWLIFDYFRRFWRLRFDDDMALKLGCMFLGFCVLSLGSFPAYIWLLASLGMISYSWLFVLEN